MWDLLHVKFGWENRLGRRVARPTTPSTMLDCEFFPPRKEWSAKFRRKTPPRFGRVERWKVEVLEEVRRKTN